MKKTLIVLMIFLLFSLAGAAKAQEGVRQRLVDLSPVASEKIKSGWIVPDDGFVTKIIKYHPQFPPVLFLGTNTQGIYGLNHP
jgi:hypothetical protein